MYIVKLQRSSTPMAISQKVTNKQRIKYIDYHWLWLQRSIRTMMWCDVTRPKTSIPFSNLSIPPSGLAKGRGLIQNTLAPSFFAQIWDDHAVVLTPCIYNIRTYIHIWYNIYIYTYILIWYFNVWRYDTCPWLKISDPTSFPLSAVTKRLQKVCETSYRRRKKRGKITGNTQQPNSNCPICWFPIYLMLYAGGWCLRVR